MRWPFYFVPGPVARVDRATPGARRLLASFIATSWLAWTGLATANEPFADIHVHFNWDQKEIVAASEIVARLRRNHVDFVVVAATPSTLALELAEAGGDLVIPIFSPYTHEMGRQDWYLDPDILRQAEQGLSSGHYRGIGEVHLMRGFLPRSDNPVFDGLLRLADRHEVPLLLHIDAGNEQPFIEVCRRYPGLKLLFAHAGGNLRPDHIRRVLESCGQAMIEFSARDPWRYGGLTGSDGKLLPGWRKLVLDYPDRFVTGTDPVWKVTRTQTWDQPDDGWDYFEQLLEYHRYWLKDLPAEVERMVRLDNGRRLFGR